MTKVLMAAITLALAPLCAAETIQVSDYATLKDVLENKAEPGDVIAVQPGVYYATSARILVQRSGTPDKPIIVRGVKVDGQRPIIDGSRVSTQRGLFNFPKETHDYILEGLELRHAIGTRHLYSGTTGEESTYKYNAAGMYFQGTNMTVRDCYSHHNEDGFFANPDADYILVENCHIAFNGTLFPESHKPTHNFYFCAKHQMVKNSYLHDPARWSELEVPREENTIFAFNWVDEDFTYSIEQASGGSLNTLWLGNLVAKRTTEGLWQGRVIAIGDGTGVVSGTVVAVNNTFVSMLPRDHHIFTFETGTANLMLFNNVFAGPANVFAMHKGQGKITGSNNWLRKGVSDVPEGLENTIYGEEPGFEDAAAMQYRPKEGSPLIDAGIFSQRYAEAIQKVLANSTSGSEAQPSPAYLAALEEIKAGLPKYEPIRKAPGFDAREAKRILDIGAYEYQGAAPRQRTLQ